MVDSYIVNSYNVCDDPVFLQHSKCEGVIDLFTHNLTYIPQRWTEIPAIAISIAYKGVRGIDVKLRGKV